MRSTRFSRSSASVSRAVARYRAASTGVRISTGRYLRTGSKMPFLFADASTWKVTTQRPRSRAAALVAGHQELSDPRVGLQRALHAERIGVGLALFFATPPFRSIYGCLGIHPWLSGTACGSDATTVKEKCRLSIDRNNPGRCVLPKHYSG